MAGRYSLLMDECMRVHAMDADRIVTRGSHFSRHKVTRQWQRRAKSLLFRSYGQNM
jgi:hypothetical protein